MARSPYTQHDRLLVVDVEPQHVVVRGAEGAPPYRARCIWAGDSPPLMRGDTLVVTNVNPSSDLLPARAGAALRHARRDDGDVPMSPRVHGPAREGGTFGTFDPVDADRVSEDLRVRCVAAIERSRSGQGAALNALVMESAGHILASDHTG